MGEKNNKIILIALIIVLVIIALVFVVMIAERYSQSPQPNQSLQTSVVKRNLQKSKSEVSLATEEEKEVSAVTTSVSGKIISVDLEKLIVITNNEEKLTLTFPNDGVNFFREVPNDDGSVSLERVGLFDISDDSQVDIRYNSSTNEIKVVSIK